MTPRAAALCACLAISSAALAQEDQAASEADAWDVTAPPLPTRDVEIDVTEGTWMSLDVSPDGETVAFDLLGDIYVVPMAGGDATAIASGLAWEYQPRFSPDGSRIAFTSDRGGGDNIWIMNADGSDKRQVTEESFRLLNNPTWSPDGRFIAAKKHFTTQRSLGTGEIWLYHAAGGEGVQLVERPSEDHQKELGEPIFSADGRYVYYTQNITPGTTFIYAQDSNTDLFNIKRYDMRTGEIETAVSGPGGSVRPAPSPDGRYMAFVRRERAQSKLYLKDLRSGATRKIYDDLDQDMQETWGVQGMYPNMDWTPDSSAVVFWAGGRIWRLDVESGEAEEIPFRVRDTRAVIDPPRPGVAVAPDTFETRMARFARVSPDGRRVVFESLGKLYIKDMDGGAPRRLIGGSGDRRELFPAWSRDGERIVFVAWDDAGLGSIRTVSASGRSERAVTGEPGHYRRPRFSPDGRTIVFEKGEGGYLTAPEWSEQPGLYRIPASGGEAVRFSRSGGRPHFGADSGRVYFTVFEEDMGKLVSADLDGEARREHASGTLTTAFEVSPDGRHVIFEENYEAFVAPLMPGPQAAAASKDATALPVAEASGDGASWPHWSNDGARLHWSMGPTLYSARLDALMPDAPADDESGPAYAPPESGVSLSMTVDAARPEGVVALTGARVITMADEDGGVIEDGVIVVDGPRIAAVGAAGSVEIPDAAEIIDVSGRTIIPGLIDAHAHGAQAVDELIPQLNWLAVAHLALGVTTVHDPSNDASEFFAAAELQRAGDYLGPRLYSTGEILYGAKAPGYFADIQGIDDAREHVGRLKAQGAHSIKNYNQPRRDQRQQVVAASIEHDMAVVAEGGSLFHMDLAMVADGDRAQPAAVAALRGRAQLLRRHRGGLHADPGGDLWRPRGRSLLAHGRRCVDAPAPVAPRAAARAAAALGAPHQGAGGGLRRQGERGNRQAAGRPRRAGQHRRARRGGRPRGALGDVVLRARRHEPARGAPDRHHRPGARLWLRRRHRLARARQAGRPRRPRGESARGHPQLRQHRPGDAERPSL